MARIVELTAGHETRLAAGVLRLRLVGTAQGAVLTARDKQGADVTFRRIDSGTILVHPARGLASILVTPTSGATFEPASRVGIDVQGEGGSEGRQVIVSQADVGALTNYEVARLEPLGGAEWLIVASPAPSGEIAPTEAAQSRSGLDERRNLHERTVGQIGSQIELLLEKRQALITAVVTGELDIPGAA